MVNTTDTILAARSSNSSFPSRTARKRSNKKVIQKLRRRRKLEEPRCVCFWINQMMCIRTAEYRTARKKELLTHSMSESQNYVRQKEEKRRTHNDSIYMKSSRRGNIDLW